MASRDVTVKVRGQTDGSAEAALRRARDEVAKLIKAHDDQVEALKRQSLADYHAARSTQYLAAQSEAAASAARKRAAIDLQGAKSRKELVAGVEAEIAAARRAAAADREAAQSKALLAAQIEREKAALERSQAVQRARKDAGLGPQDQGGGAAGLLAALGKATAALAALAGVSRVAQGALQAGEKSYIEGRFSSQRFGEAASEAIAESGIPFSFTLAYSNQARDKRIREERIRSQREVIEQAERRVQSIAPLEERQRALGAELAYQQYRGRAGFGLATDPGLAPVFRPGAAAGAADAAAAQLAEIRHSFDALNSGRAMGGIGEARRREGLAGEQSRLAFEDAQGARLRLAEAEQEAEAARRHANRPGQSFDQQNESRLSLERSLVDLQQRQREHVEAVNRAKEAQLQHEAAIADRSRAALEVLKQQRDAAQGVADAERDRLAGAARQFGDMSQLDRTRAVNLGKKLAEGGYEKLTGPEREFARSLQILGPEITRQSQALGQASKEFQELSRLFKADARLQQAEAIKVAVEQKIEATVKADEATLARQVAEKITPKIEELVNAMAKQVAAELERQRIRAANARAGLGG